MIWIRKLGLRGALLGLLCALFVLSAAFADGGNLLANPSFEKVGANGLPADWSVDAYLRTEGYTVWGVAAGAREGDVCASIHNIGLNDARFTQRVRVEPESLYRLSGWVRAESDDGDESGWGANLSVEGVYASTEAVWDTDGAWRFVEMYGETGENQTEVVVCARLGGYSGESLGTAWFDGLSLEQVDAVPGDGVARRWYNVAQPASVESAGGDEGGERAPFYPWLIAIAAVYTLALLLMLRWLGERRHSLAAKEKRAPLFWAGLALALAVRVFIALRVEGYQVDVGCFRGWGSRMASVGAANYYSPDWFCDYPPAYLYVLSVCERVLNLVEGRAGYLSGEASMLIYKLPIMACDLGLALLLERFARERGGDRKHSAALGLLLAFHPMLILNSAAWGQIDSVLTLLLCLVAWLAIRRSWRALMPVYVLAVLVKPQALMLGFLGLCCLATEWVRDRNSRKPMLQGAGLALAAALAVVTPFSIHQSPDWLFAKYAESLASYAHATVNTANLYYLFGANWVSVALPAHFGVALCLSLFAAGWGVCVFLRLRAERRRFIWAEPAGMAAFALFFLIAGLAQASWSVIGYGAMAMAFAVVLPLYLRAGKVENLPLLGGALFLLLYALGIKMHERYLFPALALLFMAYAARRDARVLLALALCGAAMFVNTGIVLDNSLRLGSAMGHLNNDTRALANLLSLMNLLALAPLLWAALDTCLSPERIAERRWQLPMRETQPAPVMAYTADAKLHWTRRDTLILAAITAVYSVVALWNLGSTKAPQTAWTSTGYDEAVVLDLGARHEDFSMAYFARVSYSDFSVETSDDGVTWSKPYPAEMAEGMCFHWTYLMPSSEDAYGNPLFVSSVRYADVQKLSGRYVRITADQIGLQLCEVVFRESVTTPVVHTDEETGGTWTEYVMTSGAQIPAAFVSQTGINTDSPLLSDGAAVCDEPDTLEGEPGWYNSTYFDEIYHARTAYEHLHGLVPYETTHPPLGKLLMSVCVAIFGMTPFGWRFAGALAGILMLPAMYLLGKQLTKRTSLAALACGLLALDCMHLTQTRIATIDSFPVLFILLATLFMLRFMQRDLSAPIAGLAPEKQGGFRAVRSFLPDLALSGFFMGCAVASKWIGVYAGLGLAVLYFWTCLRHLRMGREARELLHRPNSGLSETEKAALAVRADCAFTRFAALCVCCLVFFVAVPVLIYLLCYIPYFAYRMPVSLMEYLRLVVQSQQYMLSYHGESGRGMDHPFYSPWYEWPVNGRPMYYAMGYYQPAGFSQSIFCFGNPAVWYVGLAAVGLLAILWAWRHFYRRPGTESLVHLRSYTSDIGPAFVLISLLAQYLPWALVPRGTYIYHYFASVPFLILAAVLVTRWVMERLPRLKALPVVLLLAAALVCFILFYPYASGITAPVAWLNIGSRFLTLYHT